MFFGTLFFLKKMAVTFLERVLHRFFYGHFSLGMCVEKNFSLLFLLCLIGDVSPSVATLVRFRQIIFFQISGTYLTMSGTNKCKAMLRPPTNPIIVVIT